MDLLGDVWQELIVNGIVWGLGVAGTFVIGAIWKYWSNVPEWARVALFSLVGGTLIVFFSSFALTLLKVGAEQAAALEEVATKQEEVLDELPKYGSQRPYFTQTQAEIIQDSKLGPVLMLTVRNNEIPAENVTSYLLALGGSLSPDSAPIYTTKIDSANPIGPKEIFSH